MFKAIIFDMDGTMVDTETLHCQAYINSLEKFGKKFTEEDYWRLWATDKEMCKKIVLELILQTTWENLLQLKNRNFKESLIGNLRPQKGLMELLKKLKGDGYLMAVASSAQIEEIETILSAIKIKDYFSILASAESVEHGKPAPDIYLFTANQLRVLPEKCLVLEDAPKGVLAAKSANMKCFAIPNKAVKNGDFSMADKILESLQEVYPLLKDI